MFELYGCIVNNLELLLLYNEQFNRLTYLNIYMHMLCCVHVHLRSGNKKASSCFVDAEVCRTVVVCYVAGFSGD